MAFNFGAFAAGFGEGAAKSIETRNTAIRKGALTELDRLVGEAESKEKGLRTQRDLLTQQAKQLASFRGANNVGLTETQILGLIQQPETAKALIQELKGKKNLEEVDLSKVFQVGDEGTRMTPEEYIAKSTSVVKAPAGPTPQTRTAFGLESPALRQAEADFEAVSGRKAADVRGIARGAVDLGADFKPLAGTIDLSQFANPEAITNIKGKLRDNMAKDIPLTDPKNASLLKQLQANAIIEATFDKKGEGDADKPRTAAQINSVFSRSLAVSVDPFVIKGVVRLVPETGDYVPIGGSVEDVAAFQKQKNDTIKAQAEALGILDKKGNIIGGRNASDALLPYANIKDGKVVSFKSAVEAKPSVPEVAAPAGPRVGGISEKPIPIPSDAIVNGKVMGSKLIPGQAYTSRDGKVKTWNGVSWQ